MTRPDQTRPDQTRPLLFAVKSFLKQIDYFHVLSWLNRQRRFLVQKVRARIYSKDHLKHNPFSSKKFDKMPYIIREDNFGGAGLFSCFFAELGSIDYAVRHNMIPVVDMQNSPNQYLYPEEIGHVNSWEYFFEQPGGISLEEALSCREYILSRNASMHKPKLGMEIFSESSDKLDYWRAVCKKHIRFKPAILERMAKMITKYQGRHILGVLARGTDYVAVKPKDHPIPPTAEQAIAKAREAMQEKGFDSVYLATEDKNIAAKFQAAFGDKLLLPDSECDYIDYDYENAVFLSAYLDSDKYLRNAEYLASILFLSKCDGFITSRTSGSIGVMCLSEGFEYLYVFDLGVYP